MTPIKFAAAALMALGLAGCAEEPPRKDSMQRMESAPSVAVVVSVDAPGRTAVLEDEDGSQRFVVVPEGADSLSNVKPGDIVQYTAVRRVAAQIVAEDEPLSADALAMQGAASRDNLPAADRLGAGEEVIEIWTVSPLGDTVTYNDAAGKRGTLDVESAEGREFARGLKRYDRVRILILDTVTISTIAN